MNATGRLSTRHLLSRFFWLAMFAGHLPAAWGALLGNGSALRAGILLLSQTFFILKLIDVAWLRLPGDRRRLVAAVAVIALLHARVVESTLPEEVKAYTAWQIVAVVGGLSTLALFAHRRAAGRTEPIAPAGEALRQRVRLLWRFFDADIPPRFLLLLRSCPLDRAPPAAC